MYVWAVALVVVSVATIVILSDDATPPGKIWSPEHGHWHDAPGTTLDSIPNWQAPGLSTQLASQQPDSTPPGKVWSPEHGHWHDAPNNDSL